jgi:glycosyltransferase involved in cell wall biosynthesis
MTMTYSVADQDLMRTKSVGILNFSVQLFPHLAAREEFDELTLFSNRTFSWPEPVASRAKIENHDRANRGRLGRIAWDQWGLYQAGVKSGNEWLFLPKGFASFLRPCPMKLATYVADTIFELYRKRYPTAFPRSEGLYFRNCFRGSVKQSRVIFTNTEFVRQSVEEAARAEGLSAPPVVVAGIGFEAPSLPPAEKQDRIVLLSSRFPHKLTEMAVDYLERWRREVRYTGAIDVIGGTPAGLVRPEGEQWHWHPRLPAKEFDSLVNQARVLVFSSEYEGFGMPPVEAVLAGVSPVYSEIPATREVMRGAGSGFDNGSYDSFGSAMDHAFRVSADQLKKWATDLLDRHNWDRVVSRMVAALRESC